MMDLPVFVTKIEADHCVAAHLVPHSKSDSDEVRFVVSSYYNYHLMLLFSSTFKE